MKKLLVTMITMSALAAPLAHAGPDGKEGTGGSHHARFEETLAKLPEDKATLVRDSMKQAREENKARWERKKAIREEIDALLVAPTFDRDAYLAKVKEQAALKQDMYLSFATKMADVASKLTVEERRILAEGMPKRHGKGHYGENPAAGKAE